jgi:hypothetical protein
MWVATGTVDASGEGGSIVYSYDGSNWECADTGAPFFQNGGSSVAWNGRVWVVGGDGPDSSYSNYSMVYSYDGINWVKPDLDKTLFPYGVGAGVAARRPLPNVGTKQVPETPIKVMTENFMLVGGYNDNTGFSLGYSYDGLTWQAHKNVAIQSLIGGNPIAGIAWSGNLWAAAVWNSDNPIIVSPDGFNWVATSNASNVFTQGYGVAWNGKIWVASGSNGNSPYNSLAYSHDGLTWTAVSNSASIMYESTRAIWNGDLWVATGSIGENPSGSSLAYSYDGINWTGVSNSISLTYTARGLAWNGSYFLATGYPQADGESPSTIMRSPDGINWAGVDTGANIFTGPQGGLGIAWNGVMWVAVGDVDADGDGGSIVYSYDGSNWTCADINAAIFDSPAGSGVAWNGKVWVVTGFGPSSSNNNYSMAISYDGINWTEPDLDKSVFLPGFGLCLAARRPLPNVGTTALQSQAPKTMTENFMVAAGYGNADLTYSYDGLKWYVADTSNIFNAMGNDGYAWGVAWSGNLWVAVGTGSNTLAYSSDGIRWTAVENSPFTGSGWSAAWNGTMWVAGGEGSNTLAYSLDGINWTGADASSNVFTGGAYVVAWNGTMWVAGGGNSVGGDSNVFAYSMDGSNWTGVTSAVFGVECQGLTWNGMFWVAAGSSGEGGGSPNFAYSMDGSNWTAGTGAELFTSWANGVQWNGQMFVGCGTGNTGTLAYSYDGSNWSAASNNPFTYVGDSSCWSVGWNGALWIAAGDQDLPDGAQSMAYSYDGINWTTLSNPLTNAYAVASRRVLPFVGTTPIPPQGPVGPTGPTGPAVTPPGSDTQVIFNLDASFGASSNLTFDYSTGTLSVSAATISNNLSLAIVNGATYPQTLGNVGQVLTISSTASTLYWTTPPSASFGNVIRVDSVYGSDTHGAVGTYPFLTVGAAISAASTGMHIKIAAGTYNLAYGITIPTGVSMRGDSIQTTTLQMVDVTADTTLLTMGTNTRVEDLTLKLTSQEHHTLKGIVFGGDTSVTAKLRTCVLTVNNASAGAVGTSTVTGVECSGTGSLGSASFSFNSLKGSTINVYSDGSGNKRGILVNNTNIVTTRDLNVYVAAPATPNTATGSYVGVETADAANTGSIEIRSTTIGTVSPLGGNTYTSSDILQTHPSTVVNPTYLAGAGIQLGPGVDLVTKSAGGKPFTTYVYPTTLFYCARGTVTATKSGYLWTGTQLFAGGGSSVPDTTTPVARYRVQQPLIVSGLVASCAVGPGSGSNATVTVCKNASTGGALSGATAIAVTLSGTAAQTSSYYNTTVNFAAGDYLSVYVSIQGNALEDLVIQVDCF